MKYHPYVVRSIAVFPRKRKKGIFAATTAYDPQRSFSLHYWILSKADKANYRAHETISVKFPDGTCQQIKKLDFFAGRFNFERYMV